MNISPAIRNLYWKEARQLLPLLLLLGAVAFLLHFTAAIIHVRPDQAAQIHFFAFIGLPALYAVGAGAMLIGQEKEQRTILWLQTLPIEPRTIVVTKLVVIFIGLLAAWLLSFTLAGFYNWRFVVGMGTSSSSFFARGDIIQEDGLLLTWNLHSIFLILCSVWMAWRWDSVFSGLVALLPLSILPGLLGFLLTVISSDLLGFGLWSELYCRVVALVMLLVVAGVLSWRAGTRFLTAAPTKLAAKSSRLTLAANRDRTVAIVPHSPTAALLWQAIQQNKAFLIGNGLLLLAAGCYLIRFTKFFVADIVSNSRYIAYGDDMNFERGWLFVIIPFAFLAVSWLGASTFITDGLHNRIRFLADRGVEAKTAWWTRHAPPLAVIAAVFLATGFLLLVSFGETYNNSLWLCRGLILLLPPILMIYAFAQWAGQLTSSPFLGAIAAPGIAIAALAYISFAVTVLGCPIWLVALLCVFPMIATYLAMGRWMDRRIDRSLWLIHVGVAALLVGASFLPLLITKASVPRMSSKHASELNLAYRSYSQTTSANSNFIFEFSPYRIGWGGQNAPTNYRFTPLDEVSQQAVEGLKQQLSIHRGAGLVVAATYHLMPEATLARFASQASPDDLEKRQKYKDRMSIISDLVYRMRQSSRLIDQEDADRFELFLLYELSQPDVSSVLESDLHRSLVERLADKKSRQQARIRAVALEYGKSKWKIEELNKIYRAGEDGISWRSIAVLRSRYDRLYEELWILANGGKSAATPQRLGMIAELFNAPKMLYGLEGEGQFFRVDDIDQYADGIVSADRVMSGGYIRKFYARQWFAGWEDQAAALKTTGDSNE